MHDHTISNGRDALRRLSILTGTPELVGEVKLILSHDGRISTTPEHVLWAAIDHLAEFADVTVTLRQQKLTWTLTLDAGSHQRRFVITELPA